MQPVYTALGQHALHAPQDDDLDDLAAYFMNIDSDEEEEEGGAVDSGSDSHRHRRRRRLGHDEQRGPNPFTFAALASQQQQQQQQQLGGGGGVGGHHPQQYQLQQMADQPPPVPLPVHQPSAAHHQAFAAAPPPKKRPRAPGLAPLALRRAGSWGDDNHATWAAARAMRSRGIPLASPTPAGLGKMPRRQARAPAPAAAFAPEAFQQPQSQQPSVTFRWIEAEPMPAGLSTAHLEQQAHPLAHAWTLACSGSEEDVDDAGSLTDSPSVARAGGSGSSVATSPPSAAPSPFASMPLSSPMPPPASLAEFQPRIGRLHSFGAAAAAAAAAGGQSSDDESSDGDEEEESEEEEEDEAAHVMAPPPAAQQWRGHGAAAANKLTGSRLPAATRMAVDSASGRRQLASAPQQAPRRPPRAYHHGHAPAPAPAPGAAPQQKLAPREGDERVLVGAYTQGERRQLIQQYLHHRQARLSGVLYKDKQRSTIATRRPRGPNGQFLRS